VDHRTYLDQEESRGMKGDADGSVELASPGYLRSHGDHPVFNQHSIQAREVAYLVIQ
jgi:hypothetical protein